MESVTSFRAIIALWPSPAVMAGEIGASVAAARKWQQRDLIPAEWWRAILDTEVAKSANVTAEVMTALAAREACEARP